MLETAIITIKTLILKYGYFGTFLGVFASNTIPLYAPALLPESLVVLSVFVGLNLWLVALIATVASTSGSVIHYLIGRFSRERFVKDRRVLKYQKSFKKYGFWLIPVFAFGPLPLDVLAILSGLLKYDIKRFILGVAIGRFPRFLIFALGVSSFIKFFGLI